MNPTHVPQAMLTKADELLALGGDSEDLIPQTRCVDQLLDIYNSVKEPAVRAAVCEWLAKFAKRSMIEPGEVRAAALDICAAAAVEGAFDHLVVGAQG